MQMFLVKFGYLSNGSRLYSALSAFGSVSTQFVQRLPFSSLLKSSSPQAGSSTNMFLVFSTRFVSKKSVKWPFEADRLTAFSKQDVTVYTYKNDRFFRTMTIFGGIQLMFWANLGYFFYSVPMGRLSKPNDETTYIAASGSWSRVFFNWLSQHQSRIGGACLALGILTVGFTLLYPLRSVSHLKLLAGGDRLTVTTYSHFGTTRQFTVPIDDVSCTRSRASAKGSSVSMKIRGRMLYYLLDTQLGQFVEPELFDHVIGLNRSVK